MAKKPTTGYEYSNLDGKKPRKDRKRGYISSVVVKKNRAVSLNERILKFLIYIALRIVIRPKKWKHPEKNYEIIDRTYQKIVSADFIFIPSSIAFYIVMAFMPIFTLIMFIYSIEPIREFLGSVPIYHVTGYIPDALNPGVPTTIQTFVVLGGNVQLHETAMGYVLNSSDTTPVPFTVAEVAGQDFSTFFDWQGDPLMDTLNKFIPGIDSVLMQIAGISSSSLGAEVGAILLTIFSLITTTWIAAGGMAKLVFTQSHIYEHKYVGGYWMNRLKGMFIVLGLTVFLFLMFTVQIFINSLIVDMKGPTWAVQMASYTFLAVASFAMVFSGFLLFFKLTPRFRIKFKHVVPGAMVATVPTAGFLVLFGFITSMWDYGAYGVIGVIMYIGMTALLISIFVFMGIITNAAYYKTFVSDHVNKKWTLSRK